MCPEEFLEENILFIEVFFFHLLLTLSGKLWASCKKFQDELSKQLSSCPDEHSGDECSFIIPSTVFARKNNVHLFELFVFNPF